MRHSLLLLPIALSASAPLEARQSGRRPPQTLLCVTNASGKPVPGAEFIVAWKTGEWGNRTWPTGKRPLTEFQKLVRIIARARGQVGHALLPVSPTHTPIPLKLHPARNAQISGTVIDENGKAVSGALVAYKPLGAWEYSLPWKRRPDIGQSVTKSDSQGHFQLRDIWPEESGWLAVSKPGLVGSQLSLTPKPGERLSLRPRLTRSGRYFSGKLVDSAQKPVVGAIVVLESVTSRFQTQTTQDGSFRLLSPTEETCLLTATHARGTCSTRTRMHQSLREGLVFQLWDGRKPSR